MGRFLSRNVRKGSNHPTSAPSKAANVMGVGFDEWGRPVDMAEFLRRMPPPTQVRFSRRVASRIYDFNTSVCHGGDNARALTVRQLPTGEIAAMCFTKNHTGECCYEDRMRAFERLTGLTLRRPAWTAQHTTEVLIRRDTPYVAVARGSKPSGPLPQPSQRAVPPDFLRRMRSMDPAWYLHGSEEHATYIRTPTVCCGRSGHQTRVWVINGNVCVSCSAGCTYAHIVASILATLPDRQLDQVTSYAARDGEISRHHRRDRHGLEKACWWDAGSATADLIPLPWGCDDGQKPLILFEGQKAAAAFHSAQGGKQRRALQRYVPASVPNAGSLGDHADYSLLRGRIVYIYPDADDTGRDAASRAVVQLYAVGAKAVFLVRWPVWVHKWCSGRDCADIGANEMAKMLRHAKRRGPEPKQEPAEPRAPVADRSRESQLVTHSWVGNRYPWDSELVRHCVTPADPSLDVFFTGEELQALCDSYHQRAMAELECRWRKRPYRSLIYQAREIYGDDFPKSRQLPALRRCGYVGYRLSDTEDGYQAYLSAVTSAIDSGKLNLIGDGDDRKTVQASDDEPHWRYRKAGEAWSAVIYLPPGGDAPDAGAIITVLTRRGERHQRTVAAVVSEEARESRVRIEVGLVSDAAGAAMAAQRRQERQRLRQLGLNPRALRRAPRQIGLNPRRAGRAPRQLGIHPLAEYRRVISAAVAQNPQAPVTAPRRGYGPGVWGTTLRGYLPPPRVTNPVCCWIFHGLCAGAYILAVDSLGYPQLVWTL